MTEQPSPAEPESGRLSAEPHKNRYGHRPIKRAKRPYKSKGKPLALTQAQASRTEIERNQLARNSRVRYLHTTAKKDMLHSNKGLERARVLRVLLAGATAQQVANELKLSVNYCTTLLKDIENDIKTLGIEEFKSLLWRKMQGFMDDHTAINGSLELLLFQVDTDLRQLSVRLDGLLARIAEHKGQEPPAGEAYAIARRQWQAIGKALEGERDQLTSTRQGIRAEKVTLQREKRANNKDFVETLFKMGVTTSVPSSNNKVPLQDSTTNELVVLPFYANLSEVEALQRLEGGVEDMRKYLREQKKLRLAGEVVVTNNPDVTNNDNVTNNT